MSITIHAYRFAKELQKPLKELYDEHKDLIFMVPSQDDKRLLLEMLSVEGLAAGFPTVWRWGDLYGGLADVLRRLGIKTPLKRQLDPPDHWLVVRHLVRNALESSSHIRQAIPAIGQSGFIETIGTQLHELIGEDISREDLAYALSCKAGKDNGSCDGQCRNLTKPTGFLCHIYGQYLSYLDKNELADSALIPILARNLLQIRKLAEYLRRHAFVLVGFMSFMRSQYEFLRALNELDIAIDIYKPDPAMGDNFYDVEQQFAKEATINSISTQNEPVRSHLIACGDSRQELETCARNIWFEIQKDRISFEDIAVEIPASYQRILEDVFSVYRIPWASNVGKPLNETFSWDLLMRLKAIKDEDWPFLSVLRFLSDPTLGFNLTEQQLMSLKEDMPSGISQWAAWLKQNNLKDLLEIFRACDTFFNVVRTGISAEKLFERLFKLLDDMKLQERIRRFAADLAPDEVLFEVSKFIEAIEKKALFLKESLPKLGPAQRDILFESEAWEYLRRFAEETRLLPPKRPLNSITLYVDSSPVLASHSLYILVNATSEKWPGKIAESPLLNDQARMTIHENIGLAGIHLPLRHERRQQLEALFRRRLCTATDMTWITCSAVDVQGRPKKISPFLENALNDRLCKEDGRTERPLSRLLPKEEAYLRGAEVPQDKFSRPRKKPIVRTDPRYEGYLSDIDAWIQCPALYAYKSIFNLYPPADVGFNPQICGMMLHRLWQRAWEKRSAHENINLLRCVEELWEETVKSTYPQLLDNERMRRHYDRLYGQARRMAVVQEEILKNLKGVSILSKSEVTLTPLNIDKVSFAGRADRIDHIEGNGQIIWDYKTGSSNSYENALQLAAYALALMKEGKHVAASLYLCHENSTCIGHGSSASKDFVRKLVPKDYAGNFKIKREHLDEAANRAEGHLIEWAKDLSSGSFEPHYDKACKECQYKGFCRRNEIEREETEDNGN